MRKHMTQAQILRIDRMLSQGVTDPAAIQAVVPVHSDCIQNVIDGFNNRQSENVPTAPKRRRKKVAPVDPLS